MSKNASACAVTLCGVGLCMIGGAMMMMMQTDGQAHAAGVPAAAANMASAANARAEPTVVWVAVTSSSGYLDTFHRFWSDRKLELREVCLALGGSATPCTVERTRCRDNGWVEVPPPPGGNGFTCRSDINGDRIVDGTDLASILNSWGEEGGCEPDATYPCLDLGNLAGGVALK